MLFPWKIENFDELQLPLSLISFAEIMHTFPSYECLQKGVRDFLIFFRSCVIDKLGFCECVETWFFFILANNSSSKQNKKNPKQHFIDTDKYETHTKFQQKLELVKVFNFV